MSSSATASHLRRSSKDHQDPFKRLTSSRHPTQPNMPPSGSGSGAPGSAPTEDIGGGQGNGGPAPPPFPPGMNQQTQDLLQYMMAWDQYVRQRQQPQQPTPEPERRDGEGRFRDSEIGFFQPDLPSSYGPDDPITVGSDVFFRDVHLFVDRIRDVVMYRNEDTVKQRLPALLRGGAQLWYTSSLGELQKSGLRHTPGVQMWCDTLIEHFKRPMAESLNELSKMKYTLRDAIEQRPLMRYVTDTQRHARNAGHTQVLQQLLYAHSGLDVMFKQSVATPTATTTAADFIRQLEEKKSDWAQLARRELQHRAPSTNYGSYRGKQTPFRPRDQRRDFFAGSGRPQQNFRDTNNSPQYPNRNDRRPQDDSRPRLPFQERKLLTDGKTPTSRQGYDKRQSSASGKAPMRPFAQRAVSAHGVENEEYDDDGYADDETDDVQEVEEDDADYETEVDAEVGHITDKVAEENTSLTYGCSICGDQFTTNNKLHAHLRTAKCGQRRQG